MKLVILIALTFSLQARDADAQKACWFEGFAPNFPDTEIDVYVRDSFHSFAIGNPALTPDQRERAVRQLLANFKADSGGKLDLVWKGVDNTKTCTPAEPDTPNARIVI